MAARQRVRRTPRAVLAHPSCPCQPPPEYRGGAAAGSHLAFDRFGHDPRRADRESEPGSEPCLNESSRHRAAALQSCPCRAARRLSRRAADRKLSTFQHGRGQQELRGRCKDPRHQRRHRSRDVPPGEHPLRAQPALSWDRIYKRVLEQPDQGLFSTTFTAEREPQFKWVGPLASISWVLLAPADSSLQLTGLEQARSLRIGAYKNDAVSQHLERLGLAPINSLRDRRTSASCSRARSMSGPLPIRSAPIWPSRKV